MRIGLDFDNTLACYHHVFAEVAPLLGLVESNWTGSKTELREQLRVSKGGEKNWQLLQGQVYGKYINRAKLFVGAANFLLRLKQRGWPVVIVSHKTEFGHYDLHKIPLRQAALDWMEGKNFFGCSNLGLSKKDVHFADTRSEKVKIIAALGCDVFVDDLWEVFAEPEFPAQTQQILFGDAIELKQQNYHLVSESWREISHYLLQSETESEVRYWASYALNSEVDTCQKISGRGNSQIYHLIHEGSEYALKYYPDQKNDSRDRLGTEAKTAKFLADHGVPNVLIGEDQNEDLCLGWYRWIPGKSVTKIDESAIAQAVHFVTQLKSLSEKPQADSLPLAAEACLSHQDLKNQLELRVERLRKINNKGLEKFLQKEWVPLYQQSVLGQSIVPYTIPRNFQTLSPSDFGFHNALELPNEELVWLDFEYFGWDDPVKLICDFLWHPGMEINDELKEKWITDCCKIFGDDPNLLSRLKTDWPLYGLRWSLILLNEFLPKQWENRRQAKQWDSEVQTEKQLIQLQKAKSICQFLQQSQLECPYLMKSSR